MHITLLAIGSHGDVQPCVALGLSLHAAGHRVRIAAYANFEKFVSSHGLEFLSLFGDYQKVIREIFSGPLGDARAAGSKNPVRLMRALREIDRIMNPVREQALRDSWKALQDTDYVVHNPISYACYGVVGQNVPHMCGMSLFPIWPTGEFPSFVCPWLPNIGSPVNRLSHSVADQLVWQSARQIVNRWRVREMGMSALPWRGYHRELVREQRLHLAAFSPEIVPKPKDWPAWVHVTGFWFLDGDDTWSPPNDLVRFLEAGSPPIAIGFGSAARSPEALSRVAIEAVHKTGRRAVLLTGWAGLGDVKVPDSVYVAESVPHAWLFPRCFASVNHGGAGTIAMALRARIPCITVPAVADQPFWAKRLQQLGVSPAPLSSKNLNPDGLAQAIDRVCSDDAMRCRAENLGRKIAQERGVEKAVDILEERFRNLPASRRS